jgi:predicted Zn-dependent protease with MMP-like domain
MEPLAREDGTTELAPRRRTRDRRGRGMRGPGVLPRTLGTPALRTHRERFDAVVLDVVTVLDEKWHAELGLVEYAVEDAPLVPDDWSTETVPLSSLIRGSGATPSRLVVFRRPLEHRCDNREELRAMVLTVVVEQVAELLGLPTEVVDPRFGDD